MFTQLGSGATISVGQANEIVAKFHERTKSHEGLVRSCGTHETVEQRRDVDISSRGARDVQRQH